MSTTDPLGLWGRLWWYVTLGASTVITEEAAPLIGGLAAHDGRLRLSTVIVSIAVAGWIFAMALYYLGRWRSEWVRNRWPKLRVLLLRVIRVVRRHPWRSSLAVRVAWGLRLTLPIACGVAHVPVVVYAIGAAISSLVWSVFFTLLGWAFGETAQLVLLHVRRYEKWIVLAILIAVGIGFIITRKRRPELTEEVVEVLSRGDENGGEGPLAGGGDDRAAGL